MVSLELPSMFIVSIVKHSFEKSLIPTTGRSRHHVSPGFPVASCDLLVLVHSELVLVLIHSGLAVGVDPYKFDHHS